MANGQSVAGAPADVIVVAADADRLGQYDDAFRKARIATRVTLDADEAEGLVGALRPNVLVLDRGLPRLTLFRLYGLVREDPGETRVQIVFVGQDDDTGPGDHYLPGDPSPTTVAERVTRLLAEAGPSPATARPDASDGTVAAPSEAPAEPARQAGAPANDGAAAAPAAAPATSGVTAAAVAAAPTTATPTSTIEAPTTQAPTTEAAGGEAVVADAPTRSGRRLDVILIRVGLVLLILGALLILLQSDT